MSTKSKEMTAQELQALVQDPNTMVISWRSTDGKETRCISTKFPISAARAFSPFCVRKLSSRRGRDAPAGPTSILIFGGSFSHLSQIFEAILNFCNGNKALPSFGDLPYLNSAQLVGAAKHLEIANLEQAIKTSIETVRKSLPSPVDAVAVIQTFGRGHPAFIGMVNSFATAIVEDRLDENHSKLRTLRSEEASFDKALRDEINVKRTKIAKAKASEAEREARKQAQYDRKWPALGQ